MYDEKFAEAMGLHWSAEIYEGEFNDLTTLNLYSEETQEPIPPSLRNCNSSAPNMQSKRQQDSNVLQVLSSLRFICEDPQQIPAFVFINVSIESKLCYMEMNA